MPDSQILNHLPSHACLSTKCTQHHSTQYNSYIRNVEGRIELLNRDRDGGFCDENTHIDESTHTYTHILTYKYTYSRRASTYRGQMGKQQIGRAKNDRLASGFSACFVLVCIVRPMCSFRNCVCVCSCMEAIRRGGYKR